MPNTKRLRKLRRTLWEKDPKCHYCGVVTTWEIPAKGSLSPTAATLDHLISRLHPTRYTMDHYPSSLLVLCCYRCNNDRGRREDISLQKKVHWNSKEELKNILLTNPELAVQYS